MEANRLRSLELFEGVADDDLERCAARFQETEMLAGSAFTREGDFSYKFFIVLDGEVEVLRDFEQVVRIGPGEFFGEMGLVSGKRRNARVTACSRCKVAVMMTWDFHTMTEECPEIAARIEATVAERMAALPGADA
ncbi:MAG: cyclic nucleotide-binding domain-containing protein [Ilumatobacteraceae bacterium]